MNETDRGKLENYLEERREEIRSEGNLWYCAEGEKEGNDKQRFHAPYPRVARMPNKPKMNLRLGLLWIVAGFFFLFYFVSKL